MKPSADRRVFSAKGLAAGSASAATQPAVVTTSGGEAALGRTGGRKRDGRPAGRAGCGREGAMPLLVAVAVMVKPAILLLFGHGLARLHGASSSLSDENGRTLRML